MKKNQNFRISLYVRVSSEEQAENLEGSIKIKSNDFVKRWSGVIKTLELAKSSAPMWMQESPLRSCSMIMDAVLFRSERILIPQLPQGKC